jgi:hypothetical protein
MESCQNAVDVEPCTYQKRAPLTAGEMRLAQFAHRHIINIRSLAGFVLRHLLPLAPRERSTLSSNANYPLCFLSTPYYPR